ncbi:uncharacterized protein BO72DRAFT_254390 [Aspergillus fijiensis CBS 313.89]|uniref:Uncharacterized protein n=1 Tax=Aspergillus fijiensis CBS 313.89 TaxID=1448319 RepID=A0A8G1RIZ5_9EURO|nr:uncharacterized protein BO72DRAFT_254390 [Aspergillus fijiensis CBS 313.89]RAK72983.1 hypothetical protein BO72DRAFT_254390 [Aspergillus fijiensis CBS 313.89]
MGERNQHEKVSDIERSAWPRFFLVANLCMMYGCMGDVQKQAKIDQEENRRRIYRLDHMKKKAKRTGTWRGKQVERPLCRQGSSQSG